MNTVNEIAIQIAADVSALKASMRQAETTVAGSMRVIENQINSVNNVLGIFGVGLSSAAIVGFIKNTIDTADAMDELSQKVGISVEELSGLQVAFKFGGVEAEALQSAMTKLATAASNGNDGLKALGVSAQSFSSSRELFAALADKFQNITDGAQKTALAVEIFGKSGANLIPILNQGSEGLAKYDALAKQLGLTLDSEAAAKAAEFNDKLDEISLALSGTSTQLTQAMIPALLEMASGFNQLLLDLPELTAAFGPYLAGGAVTVAMTALPGLITAIATAVTTRLIPAMIILAPQVAAFTAAAAAIGFVISRINDSNNRLSDLESASRQISILNKQIQETEQIIADGRGSSVTQSRLKSFNAELAKATAVVNVFKKEAADNQSYADLLDMVDRMFAKKTKTFEGLNKQGKDFQKIVDEIKGSLTEENAALELTLELGRSLTESEKERIKIMQRLGGVMKDDIDAMLNRNAQLRESVRKQDDLRKAIEKANEAHQKSIEVAQAETQKLVERNKQLEKEIAQIGLKADALAEYEAQVYDTMAAEARAAAEAASIDDPALFAEKMRLAEEAEKSALLTRTKYAKQASQQLIDENNKIAKALEDGLVESFEQAFLQGGSFAESFRRAIQAEFSKLVLRPVIQAALGTGQAADGSGVNPVGLASNLAGISSGLGSIFGASGAFTSFAAASNTFANAAVFGASQLSTLAGASAATTGTLTSLAASAGAAIPYIAAAVAAYKGLEAVGVISKGETRAGGTYTLQGGVFNRTQGPSGGEFGGDEVRRAALETVNLINSTLKSLGSDSYITGFEAGLETSTKGRGGVFAGGQLSSGMGFGESLGRAGGFEQWTPQSLGAEDAFKLFAQDLMQSYLQALQVESDKFAGNVQNYIRGLGEIELLSDSQLQTAALVVQQLDYVNKNFSQMSNGLDRLSGASVEAIQNFFNAVGGFEGLNAGMAAFNQTFLTDSERFELLTQKAVQALQAVGISTDGLLDSQGKFVADARTQLRTLADGLDKTTAAGAQTFAGLLGLSGALGEVLPQLQDATQALEEVGRSAADIAQERLGLENRLLTLQGNTNELRRRELEALDSTNRSILEQIFAFEDARAAEEKLQSVRDVNQRLQEQALETQRQALQRIAGLGKSIADYVRGLSISEPTLTPQQRLQGASSEFNRLLSMAQGGDESALQQITGVSDQFLNAARDFYGSSEAFQSILANVKGGLLGLPAVETYEQQVLGLLGELNSGFEAFNLSLTEGINSVIASLVTGFDSIDLDVSGTLSFAELQAALAGKATDAQIQTLIGVTDQNNDQLISKFEFELTRLFSESQNVRNAVFNGFTTLDATANGLLDFNELRSGLSGLANDSTLQTIFRELDVNGDGVISRIEATNARLDGLAGAIRANLAPLFDSIDSNVSGGISKTEFEQAFGSFGLGPRLDQIFQEIDINGNGTIDRLEAGNFTASNQLVQDTNSLAQLQYIARLTYEIEQMAIRSAGSGIYVRPPSGGDPFNFNLNDIRGGIGNFIRVQSINQSGDFVRFRDGGLVTGPGTGTSDSIPAWLSNREFVMNAGAVSKFGSSFMEQINQGMMPVMPVPMGMQGQQVNISMDAVVRELRDLKKVVAALDLNVSVTVPVDGKKIRQDVFKQLKDDSRNGIPVVYSAGVVA